MRIAAIDYWLARVCHLHPWWLKMMGQRETHYWQSDLAAISIERPIYICGLARSGTTLLLELFSKIRGVGTHRYRDFPFLAMPILWNSYVDRFSGNRQFVERPHKDRIRINRDSPEAMEEPLWSMWFPDLHASHSLQRMTAENSHLRFEQFHRDHLRKILFIRNAHRYCAKNNYHVCRVEYLTKLYPDAEFIIPIRNPLAHVNSLVCQHQLFCAYARQETRLAAYLETTGHFEFGPQRMPIRLDDQLFHRTLDCWQAGEEHLGYSIQWNVIYRLVLELLNNEDLKNRIHVVRYEDLCASPQERLQFLLQRVGLAARGAASIPDVDHVTMVPPAEGWTPAQAAAVWHEVREVAECFGYSQCPL